MTLNVGVYFELICCWGVAAKECSPFRMGWQAWQTAAHTHTHTQAQETNILTHRTNTHTIAEAFQMPFFFVIGFGNFDIFGSWL